MKAGLHTVWHAGHAQKGRCDGGEQRPDAVAIWVVIALTVLFWVGVVHGAASLF